MRKKERIIPIFFNSDISHYAQNGKDHGNYYLRHQAPMGVILWYNIDIKRLNTVFKLNRSIKNIQFESGLFWRPLHFLSPDLAFSLRPIWSY